MNRMLKEEKMLQETQGGWNILIRLEVGIA